MHSGGNSWVDTGINGKSTIKIQLKFKMQKATGAIFVGMMLSGDQALRFLDMVITGIWTTAVMA